jgi:hypothetical protein
MFDTGLIAIAWADEVAPGVGPGVGFEIVDGCSVMDRRLPI